MASPTPAADSADPSNSWRVLVQCLTVLSPDQAPPLEEAIDRLRDTGSRLFEAVVGAPAERYGPRVTLTAGPDPARQAGALGFGAHPWGPPTWYGLRFGADGRVLIKPYHQTSRLPDGFRLPADLPSDLVVDLAARDGERAEVYLRRTADRPWAELVQAAAALVGTPWPGGGPTPRPVPGAHCLSLSWVGSRLAAVTLYAQDRSLPDDAAIAATWADGLSARDRRAYEAALGGVRALGRRPDHKAIHGLLGWTLTADGPPSRSVSLRLLDPLPPRPP